MSKIMGLIKGKKKLMGLGLCCLLMGAGAYLLTRGTHAPAPAPATAEHEDAHAVEEDPHAQHKPEPQGPKGVVANIKSAHHKLGELMEADRNLQRLSTENEYLKGTVESLRFNCASTDARNRTMDLESLLSAETGSQMGRTLASIHYRPPTNLLPAQHHTQAVSYFKAQEYEKSAVILTFLTSMEKEAFYKTAENFLLAGISWYQVDHFKLSIEYFDKVIKLPATTTDRLRYQAQARLWKALAFERTKDHSESQYWLKQLIDHHPKSQEAEWINTGIVADSSPIVEEEAVNRQPAAQEESKGEAKDEAKEEEAAEPKHEEHGHDGSHSNH